MKVKKRDIEAMFLAIVFYEVTVLPHTLFLGTKYLVVLLIFVLNLHRIKNFGGVFLSIALYGAILIYSSFYNHMSINSCVAAIVYIFFILDMYLVCTEFAQSQNMMNLIKIFTIVFLITAILNDLCMLFIDYNYSNPAEEYLIGNKFVVSYLHAFLFSLVSFLFENRKSIVLKVSKQAVAIFILGLFICIKVQCSTGVMAMVSMFVLHFIPDKITRKFCNPIFFFTLWLIMNVLIFGNVALFQSDFVQNIIVNVFHKDANMTGRLRIYGGLLSIISNSPIIGYGYFSPVVNRLFIGNAQNGIMKIIIDCGVVGLAGYVGIVFYSLKQSDAYYCFIKPIIIFLLGMSICSSVEICLTEHIVFLAYTLIFAITLQGKVRQNMK